MLMSSVEHMSEEWVASEYDQNVMSAVIDKHGCVQVMLFASLRNDFSEMGAVPHFAQKLLIAIDAPDRPTLMLGNIARDELDTHRFLLKEGTGIGFVPEDIAIFFQLLNVSLKVDSDIPGIMLMSGVDTETIGKDSCKMRTGGKCGCGLHTCVWVLLKSTRFKSL